MRWPRTREVARRCALLLSVFTGLMSPRVHGQQPDGSPVLSVEAARSDLRFLRKQLERKHPALGMYTTLDRLAHAMDSLEARVDRPLTELRFLSTIAALYPLIGDGHTMFLPSALTSARGPSTRKLPLDVALLEGRAYIRRNGTSDQRLRAGGEILAINDVPASAVIDTLLRRQIRDGYNTTYPTWILNNWFREYYRFSFGEPAVFRFVITTEHGQQEVAVDGLTPDSIRANFERNDPGRGSDGRAFGLRYADDSVGVLTIPSFERGSFSGKTLDRLFDELHARRVQRLIIDLRDNQGGEPVLAKRLLAHVLDTPFMLVRKGPASGLTEPRVPGFQGELVVLMNGGSFSATGMVLSCLASHDRAILVGEECGGNGTVIAGSPQRLRLPNSRITCYISTRLWHLADRPNDGHGVLPTIQVRPTVEDLLTDRDPVMEEALRLLH